MMKLNVLISATLLAFSFAVASAHTQTIEVNDAWVRATVTGQMGTGAFMSLISRDGARLVGVSSSLAGVAEVHEMKMEGDVMKMRPVPVLDLPAGKSVQLKPGGYHVMLMDLKQPLTKGSTVPLTLVFKNAQGVESRMDLKVPVAATAPGAAPNAGKPTVDHSGHNN